MTAALALTEAGTNPRICKGRVARRRNESPLGWSPRSRMHRASTTVTGSVPPMRPMKTVTPGMAKKAGITFITVAVRSMMGHGVRRGRARGAADITTRAQWTREVGRENTVTITPTGITGRAMGWSVLGGRANGGPGRRTAHDQEQERERGAPGGGTEVMEGGGSTGREPVKLSPRWKERSNKRMERRRRASLPVTGKTFFSNSF